MTLCPLLSLLLATGPAVAAEPVPGPFDLVGSDWTLVSNGGMESATSGKNLSRWDAADDEGIRLAREDDPVFKGNFSARLVDTDAVPDDTPVIQESDTALDLTQGRTYVLSAFVWNALQGNGEAYVDLGANIKVSETDTGTQGPCEAHSTAGYDDWEFVSCVFRANSNNPRPRMVVRNSTGGFAAFDEVALTSIDDYDAPLSLSYDYDGDGYTTQQGDCDESDPDINPGEPEVWYDGVDANCDEADDYDQDGDGVRRGEDCDDTDRRTYPGAIETWYDGKDQNCDGKSDYDRDYDGHDSASYGGDDCNDSFSGIYPGAPEYWYDGVDQSCDGNDDDRDLDGFASTEAGGPDCDDDDPDINPDSVDILNDGIDQDCDGVDLVDYVDREMPTWRQANGLGPHGCSSTRGLGALPFGWAVLLLIRRRRS